MPDMLGGELTQVVSSSFRHRHRLCDVALVGYMPGSTLPGYRLGAEMFHDRSCLGLQSTETGELHSWKIDPVGRSRLDIQTSRAAHIAHDW